jgi:transcriptional regulator with XRE-family HTH domain
MVGNIPRIIKNARVKKKMTQKQVAKLIGKSKNVISNWENALNKPDIDDVELLCSILDILPEDIFEKQKNKNSSTVELSEDEAYLIKLWRQIPHDEQMKLIGRMENEIEEHI